MGNHHDTTTNNQASGEEQQPHDDNNNVNATGTGTVPAVGSSTSPNPHPPLTPLTGQINVGGRGGSPSVTPSRPHRGSPSPPLNSQDNVGGRSPHVTPPRPNRGISPFATTPVRGSHSGRGSSFTRNSQSGRGTPPSGRGSPSSSTSRGSSTALRPSGPVSLEISVGSSVTAGASMAPTGGSPGKRKADLVPLEGVNPVCSVCKRSDFCSWKALFGHMRCHPDRQWRGCFPPPGFEEATQQVLQQGEGGSGQIFGFDLNQARGPDEEEEVREEEVPGKFDLNMPPPDDD